jgi:hypothetical protein
MHFFALAAQLAGVVHATPVAQDFDWAAIEDPSLDNVPEPDIPIVSAQTSQTTIAFDPSAAVASVSSAVTADPTDTSLKQVKRDNSGCAVQPTSDDTDANFSNDQSISAAAASAPTPPGYQLASSNQPGYSNGVYGYMGFSVLQTYDVNACAAQCNANQGCSCFNICELLGSRLNAPND